MIKKLGYVDFLNGNLLKNMAIFAIPLMLTSIIQLLFNAADMMVVGKFGSSVAMAAVSSTSSLIHLVINFFVGLSVGTNVVVARAIGANNSDAASKSVHTAICLALIGGFVSATVGILVSRVALEWMDTPDDVIEQAVLYVRIYFLGAPGSLIYNFGSSVLRSVGDSKRPMYFMTVSGVVNIVLNLVLVIVFHLDAAGVAIATSVSNYIAAFLTIASLMKLEGPCRLFPGKLRLDKESSLNIIRIGVPSGIQSCLFSISNTLIQSSVNSFGSVAMSGNAVSQNIEGFESISINAAAQAAMTFTSQNLGAKKHKRIRPIFLNAMVLASLIWITIGGCIALFRAPIMSLYTDSAEVESFAILRFAIMVPGYILGGMMDVSTCTLRGLGCSVPPMIVTVMGVCVFRVAWIYTVFKSVRTLRSIYISYPISWLITFAVNLVIYLALSNKKIKQMKEETTLV